MSNRQNSNFVNTKHASNSKVKEDIYISNVKTKTNENCKTLEKILDSPGLYHLAENIFGNLNVEDLEVSREINKSSKQIMDDPMFWLRKLGHLSKENQKDWIKAIQSVRNTEKDREIISYLKWNLKKQAVIDLPCFTTPTVQDKFMKKIFQSCGKAQPSNQSIEIVKILAPLTDTPNAPSRYGITPIHEAARSGNIEIVKILAPLTDNPNAANSNGDTPIHEAARKGHMEIVKILVPLTDNPNASDKYGQTPIYWAAMNGHKEIVKILVPLTDNPNAPNNFGMTPIHKAAQRSHSEIVKILKSFKSSSSKKRNAGASLAKPNKKRAKKV